MSAVRFWNGSSFITPSALKRWNGTAFVDIGSAHIWDGTQFVKVWPLLVLHDPETTTFTNTASAGNEYTPPSWWRDGIDYLDYIGVGAGGQGGAYQSGSGTGGGAGSWNATTVQTFTSLRVYVGKGNTSSNTTGVSGTRTSFGVVGDQTRYLQSLGGSGGAYGGGSGTNWQGKSPGNFTYQGITYTGGAAQTAYKTAGHAPGGGGSGTNQLFTYGGAGGDGRAWIVARQNRDVT